MEYELEKVPLDGRRYVTLDVISIKTPPPLAHKAPTLQVASLSNNKFHATC